MQADENSILDIAHSELEFFRSLRELVLRTAETIKSENMDELMLLLQEKQTIISRYDIILDAWNDLGMSFGIKDGRDNPEFWDIFFQSLPEASDKNACSVKLRSLLEQIKDIAEELVNIENEAQEVLNEYVKRLRVRISQVSKGRDACKGYARAGGASLSGY